MNIPPMNVMEYTAEHRANAVDFNAIADLVGMELNYDIRAEALIKGYYFYQKCMKDGTDPWRKDMNSRAPAHLFSSRAAIGPTPAEVDVMNKLVTGMSIPEIARMRGRSRSTVENQVYAVKEKLGARNLHHLAAIWAVKKV